MQVDHFIPPPAHPLRPFVNAIFRVRARDAYVAETLLPRGNADILFNLGPPVLATRSEAPADVVAWKTTLVCGLRTRPIVSRPGREVYTLGISLRPETWFSLLRIPLDDLTDNPVDGSLLFRDADSVLNRLGETASFERQCALLLQWLMAHRRSAADGAAVTQASRLLRREPDARDVGRTARTLGMSARHLQRLFLQRVGVTPSHYTRLTRFVDALKLISPRTRLTDVAAQARYFDQAHFCRDFRMFAEMTPDEYRQAGAMIPGLIFSR